MPEAHFYIYTPVHTTTTLHYNNNNNNNSMQRHYSRFVTISSQRRKLSPICTLKWPGQTVCKSCATHRALITCMLCATWYKGTAQLLSLTELKSHLFELYFTGWTIKPMMEGRKPEYPEKTPGDELQKSHCKWMHTWLTIVQIHHKAAP